MKFIAQFSSLSIIAAMNWAEFLNNSCQSHLMWSLRPEIFHSCSLPFNEGRAPAQFSSGWSEIFGWWAKSMLYLSQRNQALEANCLRLTTHAYMKIRGACCTRIHCNLFLFLPACAFELGKHVFCFCNFLSCFQGHKIVIYFGKAYEMG